MTLGRVFAGLLLALLATGALAAPLEAYGQLPSLERFTISPDGKNVAYVTNVDGKRAVLITAIDQGKVTDAITLGDQKLRDLTWGDNDNLILTMSVTHSALGAMGPRAEYFMAQGYRLSTHLSRAFLRHGTEQMNIVLNYPQVRSLGGHATAFFPGITFMSGQTQVSLFSVDVETGDSGVVEVGTKIVQDWIIDGNGAIAGRITYDNDSRTWGLQISDRVGYKTIASVVAPIETPTVQGITADGNGLLVAVPQGDDFVDRVYLPGNGSWATAPAGADAHDDPILDPVSRRVIGMAGVGENFTYTFFNEADQKAWDGLVHAFPGESVALASWSNDRKRVVVRVDGRRDGAGFYLVDLTTHQASFLGPVYSGIETADMAEVKRITYDAADGMKIPAYLTLPNGKPAKNLPLVVLAHGGPAYRDQPQFDWMAQAFASRGYAVLQPEFRGSDGYGWAHLSAGFGQWGRKMQTDLSDGVRALAAQGIVDAKRVCIVGGSYGGYAALAGAALDRGVYRCAVADAPVSDPQTMLKWVRERAHDSDAPVSRYWDRFMGVTNYDDPKLAEISPLHHAADVSIPVLLIHGKDDTVVPIEQSEQMEAALKAAGKPVTFVRLEGEDHWLSRSETRLQMLQSTVQFLEADNPPN
jgi:acetyl esterase/lipase